MHKKWIPWIAIAGLAVATIVGWQLLNPSATDKVAAKSEVKAPAKSGGPGGKGGGGPVAVEVGRAELTRLIDATEAVGSLRAHRQAVLRPEVSGRVAAIGFAEGQQVRSGQLLVQLDDALQQAQVAQAKAQFSIASTQLTRSRELLAQGFVSQSAVDQSASALQVAQAQVALAEAQLARMRIVSPFDALAGVRKVELGDFVKDGAELVTLQDMSQLWVDFRLAERFLPQVKSGQAVTVSFDAIGAREFSARVEALDAQLDSEGRSLLVRARLLERSPVLKPGMFARARTVLSTRDKALVVPEEALVPQGGKQYLIKVVDGPKGPTASRMEAKIGTRLHGQVEILEGLSAGERIVTAGQERLMRGDGQALKIVQIGKAAAPALPASGATVPAAAASAAPAGARAPA